MAGGKNPVHGRSHWLGGADPISGLKIEEVEVDDVVVLPSTGFAAAMLRTALAGWTNQLNSTYIYPPASGPWGTNVLTENTLRVTPLALNSGFTFDQAGLEITSGDAGSTVRLGLYNTDPATGTPSTLHTDFGTVSSASTGVKTTSISLNITETNVYWLAALAKGGSPTAICNNIGNPIFWSALQVTSPPTTGTFQGLLGINVSVAGTTFPDPFPDSSVYTSSGRIPLVWMRVA